MLELLHVWTGAACFLEDKTSLELQPSRREIVIEDVEVTYKDLIGRGHGGSYTITYQYAKEVLEWREEKNFLNTTLLWTTCKVEVYRHKGKH